MKHLLAALRSAAISIPTIGVYLYAPRIVSVSLFAFVFGAVVGLCVGRAEAKHGEGGAA